MLSERLVLALEQYAFLQILSAFYSQTLSAASAGGLAEIASSHFGTNGRCGCGASVG
jgi:hypothetical protein